MANAERDNWFAREIQIYEPEIRAYLKNKFPTLEDIDDIIQEAYARLLKVREEREIKEPRALLYTVARNIVYDLFRRTKVVQFKSLTQFPDLSVIDDRADIEESVNLRDEINLLIRAVETLPKRCRQIMTLRMIYGYSRMEIAEELGISANTVKAQLAKGMRKSAAYLSRYEDQMNP
ncbi:MAG: sigma-70 family RNA polymerase sigma factor [Verrucomicrobia bacterium]|nr:sigma-70 family RNA polymerase sigma factor [Verrucomicrobiota bacterium]MDA1065851.1 sigma-70 family RNA polymerase sigma factor [Verrucomicrobiota bacterium]